MKLWRYPLFITMILLFSTQALFGFGKNKVIYKNFEWYYLQSKHFDIYFYEGGQDIAEFTAEVAESAYVQIKHDWRFDIRERIVLVVYNSHNDWQQTNVVFSYLDEGIGGVTELYKNRIVVPYEGNYEQFRHVIHHELVHAVMNDMLYGGSIQSLVVGEVTPAPLWFSEGIAEFQATGWSVQQDMIVRDAVLHNYMPTLQSLQYYLVYQGGNSVFKYIASTYGRKKMGEFLHKMRGKVSFERVLQSALGIGSEEFTERWHRYLKKQYWPDIEYRKEPMEIAKRLTNHRKISNFLNVSPTISPNGDKIAFISDRKGYQNVYLMSAIDGRILKTLVKGNTSESFEELHWLRPGMSFSPDGRKLALAAKSGSHDAVFVIDIKSGKKKRYLLRELDGAFTTSWSPDGDKIAFVGNESDRSDIYVLNLKTEEITALTNDVFTDDQPSWSADSKTIAFVSDRKDFVDDTQLPEDFRMSQFDYEKRDIYLVDLDTKEIRRITDTPWQEANPIFSPDGKKLAYVSDKNGISNLYIHELDFDRDYPIPNIISEDGITDANLRPLETKLPTSANKLNDYPVTDIISGIMQINWDRHANKMVFTSFFHGGFDIFVMNNPLGLEPIEELKPTKFVQEMSQDELPIYARTWKPSAEDKKSEEDEQIEGDSPADYSSFVFTRYKLDKKKKAEKKKVALADNSTQNEDGDYKVRKYKLKFSPDIVSGSAGYNTFFGFAGYTTFAFSDLLGDHKIFLNVNLVSDLKNSDLNALYLNSKKRLTLGVGGYHTSWFFNNSFGSIQRYRNYGFNILGSYPFSRFNRLEMSLNWYNISLEHLTADIPDETVSTILPSVSYVHDNVLWGFIGPVDGSRYAVNLLVSPKFSDNSRDFRTISADFRKYFMLSRDYNFMVRFSSAYSWGSEPQQFFLGGIDNWINYKTRGAGLRTDNIGDIFFSQFVTPLRGAPFYESEGNSYALANLEFRFPLIQFLGLGFPPIRLFNIRGAMFYDIGTTYTPGSPWRGTRINESGQREFGDIVSGFGVGARVYFLYFLMRIDVAWQHDLDGTSKPVWLFSLGGDL